MTTATAPAFNATAILRALATKGITDARLDHTGGGIHTIFCVGDRVGIGPFTQGRATVNDLCVVPYDTEGEPMGEGAGIFPKTFDEIAESVVLYRQILGGKGAVKPVVAVATDGKRTEIPPSRAEALWRALKDEMVYMYGRWQDEKEYEDWGDYRRRMLALVNEKGDGAVFVRCCSRPFSLRFSIGTGNERAVYEIRVTACQYSFSRLVGGAS